MDGILNINKPKGYTSHDVVAIVRKRLGTKKVGHTGTLDPNATGVLPICVGRGTKLASVISESSKTYRAQLILGQTTTTLDVTGEVTGEADPSHLTQGQIEEAVMAFQGAIEQIPPMYSALSVDGVRLYKLARQGIEIERKPRHVTIHAIKVVEFTQPHVLTIEVSCSSGTYIRTLCADVGARLGVGGIMGELTRIESGGYTLADSQELETFSVDDLMTLDSIFEGYPRLVIKPAGEKFLLNGNKISVNYAIGALNAEGGYRVYDQLDKFYGLYEQEKDMLKPRIYTG